MAPIPAAWGRPSGLAVPRKKVVSGPMEPAARVSRATPRQGREAVAVEVGDLGGFAFGHRAPPVFVRCLVRPDGDRKVIGIGGLTSEGPGPWNGPGLTRWGRASRDGGGTVMRSLSVYARGAGLTVAARPPRRGCAVSIPVITLDGNITRTRTSESDVDYTCIISIPTAH